MDNQHRKITGYGELSQEEIDAMNAVKDAAGEVALLLERMELDANLDQRWVAIAKTDLQKGFMAAVRSVAKPGGF